jgi:hypothetical protein
LLVTGRNRDQCSDSQLRWFGLMVLNATFNNISVISWQSVLLVEETWVPSENHWPSASHYKLHHIMLYTLPVSGIRTHIVLSSHSKLYILTYLHIIKSAQNIFFCEGFLDQLGEVISIYVPQYNKMTVKWFLITHLYYAFDNLRI